MEISNTFNEEPDVSDILGTSFADSANPFGCIQTLNAPLRNDKPTRFNLSIPMCKDFPGKHTSFGITDEIRVRVETQCVLEIIP